MAIYCLRLPGDYSDLAPTFTWHLQRLIIYNYFLGRGLDFQGLTCRIFYEICSRDRS
jgi:hypothetical protein